MNRWGTVSVQLSSVVAAITLSAWPTYGQTVYEPPIFGSLLGVILPVLLIVVLVVAVILVVRSLARSMNVTTPVDAAAKAIKAKRSATKKWSAFIEKARQKADE